MKRFTFFSILFFLNSSFLAEQIEMPKVNSASVQMAKDLLNQEGFSSIEVYDSGPDFHSFAAISFMFTLKGRSLFMIINEQMFRMLDEEEQKIVILHEIGHLKSNPYLGFWYMILPSILSAFATCFALKSLHTGQWADAPGKVGIALGAGYVVDKLSEIVCARLSRCEELAADAFAFSRHKNVKAFSSLLEKRKKLFETQYPSSCWGRLFEDHPSAQERIAQIKRLDSNEQF